MPLITTEMFERQKAFQETQMANYPFDIDHIHMCLCAHIGKEVSELMDCRPWKLHRRMKAEPRERLLEEAVDVVKLWMNILILHDVGEEEFHEAFFNKTFLVEQREQKEEEQFNAEESECTDP